ncbi:ABC transporter ATP-binding protein [Alkalibacillus aidingensis]|uniref:ABC transporter ATP-binding protein n=1 Tax=Alkalibacillus aidingensis TaxID=2747607 RepID=UPI0016602DDA|nr:ABC transporter ATP-binding protein [Alkalibacillus aidingensis]
MLKVNNVEAVYSKMILALRGMSLEVPKGKIIALLGSNGAGKSTTLQSISGLLSSDGGQITDGTVEFEGETLNGKSPDAIVKSGIFHCMEGRHVFPHLTVEENLTAGAYTRKDRRNIQKDIDKIYGYFPKLRDLKKRPAGLLSGGEQQMLAIGRGLMAKPKLLLLDEPSLGIAPLLVEEIFENIKQINEEEGTSILVVEQNANVALKIADYGYIMENGRVVMQGEVDRLLEDDEVQNHYLGIGTEEDQKEVVYKSKQERMVW